MIYFDSTHSVAEKTKNLLGLLKDATLTDVTCIEELMKKCVAADIFETEVYTQLWKHYTSPSRTLAQQASQMSREQLSKMKQTNKEEQRAAIQLLRMIGSSKVEVLQKQKDSLYKSSLEFANYENPDFILLKEALLGYEKIML